jgi:hypothetical protein
MISGTACFCVRKESYDEMFKFNICPLWVIFTSLICSIVTLTFTLTLMFILLQILKGFCLPAGNILTCTAQCTSEEFPLFMAVTTLLATPTIDVVAVKQDIQLYQGL